MRLSDSQVSQAGIGHVGIGQGEIPQGDEARQVRQSLIVDGRAGQVQPLEWEAPQMLQAGAGDLRVREPQLA